MNAHYNDMATGPVSLLKISPLVRLAHPQQADSQAHSYVDLFQAGSNHFRYLV